MTTRRRRTIRNPKEVDTIRHFDATRPNLPNAEHQSLTDEDEHEQSPIRTGYNHCMSKILDRKTVLGTLREHKPMLKELFGITEVALYGSFARDEGTEESDIDVVVQFEGRPTLLTYGGARVYIENIFGRSADLCQLRELRKEVRPNVERELINV